MTIVLADVQPTSINLPEPVAENDTGDGKFSNLMDQQMRRDEDSAVGVDDSQTVEIKDININSGAITAMKNELVADAEVPPAWLEFLDGQQVNATSVGTGPVTVDMASLTEESNNLALVSPNAINPAVGELLPGSGKALPVVDSQLTATAIQAPAVQNELLRQAKQSGTNLVDQRVAAAVDATNLKTADLTGADTAKSALSLDMSGQFKTNVGSDVLKGSEFQVVNNAIAELGDAANSNNRSQGLSLGLANAVTQPASQLLPTQLETLTVNNTRDTAAWGTGIGERVHYMINQKLNTATIRLDPPMLGRLEVHIQVNDDITNVTINTQNAQTREIIDNASFRLREYLQENGYQNVNVDVSHQQEQQQQASQEAGENMIDGADEGLQETGEAVLEGEGNQYFSSDSVVDYFV